MLTRSQLKTATDALEAQTSVHTGAKTESGYWRRIALALEEGAGAASAANNGRAGWMLRAAVAAETAWGGSGAEENRSTSGLLKRIVDAMEINAGVGTGSLSNRLATAAGAVSFGASTLVTLDFENNTYSINGVSKTRDQCLAEDLNWGNYNPADFTNGVGMTSSATASPVLSAAAFAAVGSNFTAVVHWTNGADLPTLQIGLLDLPSYAIEIYATIMFEAGLPQVKQAGTLQNWGSTPAAGQHVAAVTLSAALAAMSIDGGAAVSIDPANTATNSVGLALTASTNSSIQKIEFITAVAAAALPALSA